MRLVLTLFFSYTFKFLSLQISKIRKLFESRGPKMHTKAVAASLAGLSAVAYSDSTIDYCSSVATLVNQCPQSNVASSSSWNLFPSWGSGWFKRDVSANPTGWNSPLDFNIFNTWSTNSACVCGKPGIYNIAADCIANQNPNSQNFVCESQFITLFRKSLAKSSGRFPNGR
jgi:hypothetical protein